MKVKVDRVNSLAEAIMLKQLGVALISVPFFKSMAYKDNRFCDLKTGLSIIKTFGIENSIAEVSFKSDWRKTFNFVIENGIKCIQPIAGEELDIEVAREFLIQGVKVIFSNINISYDDEIDWFLEQFSELKEKEHYFLQLDLLGDVEGSWEFMKNECPKYPEELQVHEVIGASEKYRMFGILDFDYYNVKEITSVFSYFYGITFVLGEKSRLNNIHYCSYNNVTSLLTKILPLNSK